MSFLLPFTWGSLPLVPVSVHSVHLSLPLAVRYVCPGMCLCVFVCLCFSFSFFSTCISFFVCVCVSLSGFLCVCVFWCGRVFLCVCVSSVSVSYSLAACVCLCKHPHFVLHCLSPVSLCVSSSLRRGFTCEYSASMLRAFVFPRLSLSLGVPASVYCKQGLSGRAADV